MKIELCNVNKKINNNFELKNINIQLDSNDITGLIGDNGAGKTTIIKTIFNEITPDSGEVKLDGEILKTHDQFNKLAFFPDTNSISTDVIVEKYLTYVGELSDLKGEKLKPLVDKVIEITELEKFRKQRVSKLSAGWKKKFILAAVLIQKPSFVVFDEPTANVDLKGKEEFLEVVDIMRKNNIGIMITSHIVEELQPLINRVIFVKNGEIVYNSKFDGKIENLKDIYSRHAGVVDLNVKETKKKLMDDLFKN